MTIGKNQGFLHEEETPFFTRHELTRCWLYKAKAADKSASTTSYHERIPFPPFRRLKASATSPRVSSIVDVCTLPAHCCSVVVAWRLSMQVLFEQFVAASAILQKGNYWRSGRAGGQARTSVDLRSLLLGSRRMTSILRHGRSTSLGHSLVIYSTFVAPHGDVLSLKRRGRNADVWQHYIFYLCRLASPEHGHCILAAWLIGLAAMLRLSFTGSAYTTARLYFEDNCYRWICRDLHCVCRLWHIEGFAHGHRSCKITRSKRRMRRRALRSCNGRKDSRTSRFHPWAIEKQETPAASSSALRQMSQRFKYIAVSSTLWSMEK